MPGMTRAVLRFFHRAISKAPVYLTHIFYRDCYSRRKPWGEVAMPPTGKAVLRLSLLALLLILGATIAQHQAESAHAAPNVVACNPGDPGYPNCSMMPSSGGSGGCCGSSMPSGNSGCCGSSMPSGNSGCCGSPYGSNVLPPTVCLAAVHCGAPTPGQG